jgi:uncharacterized membrane protein YsdA (DUF1294 family)
LPLSRFSSLFGGSCGHAVAATISAHKASRPGLLHCLPNVTISAAIFIFDPVE